MGGVIQTFNNINYTKEKLNDGKIRLNIEITNERFEIAKERVFERLAPTVNINGFRPGKAPKNLVMAYLGPTLFEQTLNDLVPVCTLEVLQRENLKPIDNLEYKIETVAEGTGVKYSATFTSFPDFKLVDLSKIKIKKGKVEVKDEEIQEVIKQMYEDFKKVDKTKYDIGISDKWASSLNLGVKNLKELKKRVRKELERQKELQERDKYVSKLLIEIAEKSKFIVPSILIEKEVNRKEMEYKLRIEKIGVKLDDFLRNQKITIEDLRKGWKKEAMEDIKIEIVIMKIADEYKIEVKDEEVDQYINSIKDEKLKEHYKDQRARKYLKTILFRQKVVNTLLEKVEGKA